MIVNRYGVHWAAGGIGFLIQGNGEQHALPIEDLSSGFDVRIPGGIRCPHKLDLRYIAPAPPEIDDPLFRVMLPLPASAAGPRAWMIEGPVEALEPLKVMGAPLEQTEEPIWWRELRDIARSFNATNIGTMVFTLSEVGHTERMLRVMEMARSEGRRLLFVTTRPVPAPPGVQRIETALGPDVVRLPLRQIGAGVLRNYLLTRELLI